VTWKTYHAHAWQRTAPWFSKRKELVRGAAGAVALAAIWWAAGAHHAAYGVLIAAAVGALASTLLVPAVAYSWHFLRAPRRMREQKDHERDDRITALEDQVRTLASTPAKKSPPPEPPGLRALRDLQRQGQLLLSRCPILMSYTTPDGLVKDIDRWEKRVKQALKEQDSDDGFLLHQFVSEPTSGITTHLLQDRMSHRVNMLSRAIQIISARR